MVKSKKTSKNPKIHQNNLFGSCFTFCTFKLFLPKNKFAHLQIGP